MNGMLCAPSGDWAFCMLLNGRCCTFGAPAALGALAKLASVSAFCAAAELDAVIASGAPDVEGVGGLIAADCSVEACIGTTSSFVKALLHRTAVHCTGVKNITAETGAHQSSRYQLGTESVCSCNYQ